MIAVLLGAMAAIPMVDEDLHPSVYIVYCEAVYLIFSIAYCLWCWACMYSFCINILSVEMYLMHKIHLHLCLLGQIVYWL